MLFKRALADSLHKANGTIHSSDSVQVPRLSRFESALAFGLGGRNTHHCHRRPRMHLRHGACYTLNIYDYLLQPVTLLTHRDRGLRLPRVAGQLWPHHAVGFEEGRCKG